MNILITGGAGYIGTSLINELAPDKNISSIIIYDNFSRKNYGFLLSKSYKNYKNKIKIVKGDILDRRSLLKILDGVDVLIHLAAKVTTPFANIDHHQYDQMNHWGTAQIAQICSEYLDLKVLYASSASVYGHTKTPVNEDAITSPDCYYGISKYKAEKQLSAYVDKTNLSKLRIGNVYGMNESVRIDSVVNKFMFEAITSNIINIDGKGDQIRPIIHVSTVANAFHSILKNNVWGETYNLFSENISVNDIAMNMKKTYSKLEIIYINQDHSFHNLILDKARLIDKIGVNLSTYNLESFLIKGF